PSWTAGSLSMADRLPTSAANSPAGSRSPTSRRSACSLMPRPPVADAAPSFTIREIRPDEYAALGEVTVRAYAAVPGDDSDYHPQLRNVARRASRIPVLVAVDPDGRVLGGVAYVPEPGAPYSESERG